jgi:hypothetical protein
MIALTSSTDPLCQIFSLAVIRTDGESTIEIGTNFEAEPTADGYHVERSPPHTQALNGKAERAGHVLITRATGLEAQARFPDILWPEIIVVAALSAESHADGKP